jgi:cob(I)alamin adenosyltransferase
MPKLTRLYTRKGDEGETSLGGGQRVPKDALRVAAVGTLDELNACLGLALAHGLVPRLAEVLPPIQNELFHLGSDLCFLEEDKTKYPLPQIEARHIARLEALIDEFNAAVGPLKNFILPGGTVGAAHLHLARTICRRAERAVVSLARKEPIGEFALRYLNRLSDLLFAMARFENKQRGVDEPLWDSRA